MHAMGVQFDPREIKPALSSYTDCHLQFKECVDNNKGRRENQMSSHLLPPTLIYKTNILRKGEPMMKSFESCLAKIKNITIDNLKVDTYRKVDIFFFSERCKCNLNVLTKYF